jgi:MFS transporter, OFA family, oxalate/formate antiporter
MPEARQDLRLLGMKPETGRWLLVLVGAVIELCLGAIYAYSVFKGPLATYFDSVGDKPTDTAMLLPFIVFLAVFALTMPLAGRPMERYGPRVVAAIGGVVMGLGWFLASLATDPMILALLYGVVGGTGVGLAYGCPIAVSTRWFPDRRGLAVGLTVLGFGFSALVTGALADQLIASQGGVMPTLRILGVVFLVIVVALSMLLRFPPKGWRPAGFTAPAAVGGGAKQEFLRGEMLRTGAFWGIWICYTIGTLAGLMAIGIAKPVGTDLGVASATATTLVGVFAVFNGLGRPVFGGLTDRLGVRNVALLSFVMIGSAALLLWLGWSQPAYVVAFCALWAGLGGWLAIAPAATASFFGTKDYARNYGVMFTAYGAGAIAGSVLAGQMKDVFGSYLNAFPVVAGLAAVGIVVALVAIKPPVGIRAAAPAAALVPAAAVAGLARGDETAARGLSADD